MKKKIFGGIALLAIAATAVWNVNLNSQSNDLSAVSLANIEALAQEGSGVNCFYDPANWNYPCAHWSPGDNCPCGW
jgi:hypothetical protein